jgi:hypothetical protein
MHSCCRAFRGTARSRLRALPFSLAVIVAAAGCGPARRAVESPEPTIAESLEPAIADRVEQYGPSSRARLAPYFAAAGAPYPPARFLLLGLKRERELQLYAAGPE